MKAGFLPRFFYFRNGKTEMKRQKKVFVSGNGIPVFLFCCLKKSVPVCTVGNLYLKWLSRHDRGMFNNVSERPHMTNAILRLPQVKDLTGLSRSTIYLMIKQGKFRKPIQLGTRSVGWLQSYFRNNREGEREYLILPEAYRTEVCRGFDARTVSGVLLKHGWLKAGSDGKAQVAERIPSLGKVARVYVLTSRIWDEAG